jgi:hypothetical protein
MPRPDITEAMLRSLMVVCQVMAKDGSGWLDFSTIRDHEDVHYAFQAVEGTHHQFKGDFRIVHGRTVIYAKG